MQQINILPFVVLEVEYNPVIVYIWTTRYYLYVMRQRWVECGYDFIICGFLFCALYDDKAAVR